jgi:hypothetical protein
VKYAMPLFEHCVEDPLLANRARLVLVEAFVPFAPTLEKDSASQQKLLELLKSTESPALYAIVAAFRHDSLPFSAVSMSCNNIMEMTFERRTTQPGDPGVDCDAETCVAATFRLDFVRDHGARA